MLIDVVGYPSSAAAYCVGVEQAPRALRDAGLVERLKEVGHVVRDVGDLPVRRWRPDHDSPRAQNLRDEVEGLRGLIDALSALLIERVGDQRFLVLGGSCTVAVGVCGALRTAGVEPRMVYVDRHLDLNTPESTLEGSLSWMGMAHALGVEGAAEELATLAGRAPLLHPENLSYLGVDLDQTTDAERERLARLSVSVTEQAALVADPRSAAAQARRALPDGPFVVHVDVDVLDFQDAPLAENVNGRNSGPTLDALAQALQELWGEPDCLGLSLGQLVPAHAESDPTVIDRFLHALVPANS